MHPRTYLSFAAILAVAFVCGIPQARAADPAVRCEAGKLKESAKYGNCRLKVESKAVKKGLTPDFSKCTARFTKNFVKEELKPGGVLCPTVGDEPSINSRITQHADDVATLLAGGALHTCGDGVLDTGEQCDGTELGGTECSTLGFTGGALACSPTCFYDLSSCVSQALPATGQQVSFVSGDDGELRTGAPLQYADNGDGTVTDLNTGLMWEKKSDDGGLHDVDSLFAWAPGVGSIWEWVGTVNAEGGQGFAGFSDWRIPTYKELITIQDLGVDNPSVDPVFSNACSPGCGASVCSCTNIVVVYWTSTTVSDGTTRAWGVGFGGGGVGPFVKSSLAYVRAVRGGL